jgi:hypothetical protein
MGQASKVLKRNRIAISNVPKENGTVILAKDVKVGMSLYLDNFKSAEPKFYEVLKVEVLDNGNIVRLHTPSVVSDINSTVNLSDFPPNFPVTVLTNNIS